jgi:hypothetical protein
MILHRFTPKRCRFTVVKTCQQQLKREEEKNPSSQQEEKKKKKKMFKFLKPNKAVVLLQGHFAGHKVVIVFWGFCCFGLVKLFPFLFN